MRYFEKRPDSEHLHIFNRWIEENTEKIQEWIANDAKTGEHLWNELGKTFSVEKETKIDPQVLRNVLETALFEEQNGLCCYCGNTIERIKNEEKDIWEYRHKAIEHFEPKNKFKQKTFDYENLFFCCKESQKLTSYEVGRTINETFIHGFEEVSQLSNLPQSIIKDNPKNSHLKNRKPVAGDKIYIPNPPHCDDEKSKFDNKPKHTIIINPSKDKELIEKLIFDENGNINYVDRDICKNETIENTFNVLALQCKTLIERRQQKWLNAYINYNDVILPYWITEIPEIGLVDEITTKNIITENINKLIEGKAKPNEEGLLEPFYFVEVAFLKSLFNAQV